MLWDALVGEVVPRVSEDTEILAALEGAYVFAVPAVRPVRVPSVEWMLIGDTESEVFNDLMLQFDIFAKATVAIVLERRIRALLTRTSRQFRGTLNTSMQFVDSFTLEFATAGITHKVLRFRFDPVRRRAMPDS